MSRCFLTILFCCFVVTLAAGEDQKKALRRPPEPIKAVGSIDLQDLANQPDQIRLRIHLTAADGTTTTISLRIDAGSTADNITDAVYESIPKSSCKIQGTEEIAVAGWTATRQGTTIKIYSARAKSGTYGTPIAPGSAPTESPIRSIEYHVLGTNATPRVVVTILNP